MAQEYFLALANWGGEHSLLDLMVRQTHAAPSLAYTPAQHVRARFLDRLSDRNLFAEAMVSFMQKNDNARGAFPHMRAKRCISCADCICVNMDGECGNTRWYVS